MIDIANTEFWETVAFVLFFAVVVWKGGFGALNRALDARADKIRNELETAQKLRQDAEALLTTYQKKQREALTEAQVILAAAREDATRIRDQAQNDLTAMLKRREAQAMEKIAQAETAAVQQVRNLAVDVAIAATETLLSKGIDEKTDTALISATLKDISAKLH